MNELKKKIIEVLKPIFGADIEDTIRTQYNDGEDKELLELADYMLTSYFGEVKAKHRMERLRGEIA